MTGLIYVAIVAMWAAVLIPMWLRRHDAAGERRDERRQEALGVLAGGPEQSAHAARSRAARRRRIILAGLGVALVTAATAYVLGLVGLWIPLAALTLLIGFAAGIAVATRLEAQRVARLAARRSHRARARRRDTVAVARPPRRAEEPARVRTSTPPGRERRLVGEDWERVFDQTA